MRVLVLPSLRGADQKRRVLSSPHRPNRHDWAALPPRVFLTQRRLEHIVHRHWATTGTSAFEPAAGKFIPGMTARGLREMIRTASERGIWKPARGSRIQIEYNFGQVIGTDRYGNPATRIRIIIEPSGEVVTAFPF